MPITRSREPGATPLGRELRRILISGEHQPTPWTEAFLFQADRTQTYEEVIIPALNQGRVVVSDRNLYGTIAYQGFGGNLSIDLIDAMTKVATGGHYPDLIFVADLEPSQAIARKAGAAERDRFDEKALAFQVRVRDGYLFAAGRDSDRAHVLDASRPLDEVARLVAAITTEKLAARLPGSARLDLASILTN
jgi:dTMP kinase